MVEAGPTAVDIEPFRTCSVLGGGCALGVLQVGMSATTSRRRCLLFGTVIVWCTLLLRHLDEHVGCAS
eukprot:1811981-Rhodomonas_salina.3